MPAVRSAACDASVDPARPRSAAAQRLAALGERRVDDREHLAPGSPSSPAGRGGVQATRPESTFGAGQKTLRPIAPARRTSAYQAALTDGTP